MRFFLCFFCVAVLQGSFLFGQKLEHRLRAQEVAAFDYQEITLRVPAASVKENPFTDVQLKAIFTPEGGMPVEVEGFCDAQDGSVYKLRFMPKIAGKYSYTLTLNRVNTQKQAKGSFQCVASTRKGPIQTDAEHPWHFVFENTREHYFWNGTTAYWMLGWKDEEVIRAAIDRLAYFKTNRIRVAINGRAHGGDRWNEKTVVESKEFTFKLNPWLAERPDDLDNPGFDVTRFEVGHWQKLDRLVEYAREKGIIVSIIFYVDGLDHGCDPFKKANMSKADEQRYYRYAAARYSGFENIMWDIANEYHLFRTPEWAEQTGTLLKKADHAGHLISVHGSSDFPFRKSPWVDVVMYQSWDECGGNAFMLECRQAQAASGRPLPQVNEEYGYEGHYSVWGCGATATKVAPARSGENRSQLAWEICMAGAYQTTGETAEFGTGAGENTGGGWINGRGNYKMTMLKYYGILRETFEQTSYWLLQPNNSIVNYGNLCLENPGREYLVYSRLNTCRVVLPRDQVFEVTMIDPRTGRQVQLPDCRAADNGAWQYPGVLSEDWVFLLRRK